MRSQKPIFRIFAQPNLCVIDQQGGITHTRLQNGVNPSCQFVSLHVDDKKKKTGERISAWTAEKGVMVTAAELNQSGNCLVIANSNGLSIFRLSSAGQWIQSSMAGDKSSSLVSTVKWAQDGAKLAIVDFEFVGKSFSTDNRKPGWYHGDSRPL